MKKHRSFFKKLVISSLITLLSVGILNAANYYVDPATGSMSNNGSEASPWSTLAAVFSAGKTFSAGDVIYLKSGNHGFPVVTQSNSGDVTITKYPGANPIINRIDFIGASHWILDDVRVYTTAPLPDTPILEHPVPAQYNNTLIRINGGSSYLTISNCFVYSIENSSSWSDNDWNYKAWNGLYTNSADHHITIDHCHFKNIRFGVHMHMSSHDNVMRYTTIENINGDGLRPGNYATIEYNVIKDFYITNGNHYDMIQGFYLTNVVIRGNILISQATSHPYAGSAQGIGFFDGMFYNIIIENNLVLNHHYHGISIYGAKNCKIVNNTVAGCPLGSGGNPWIAVYNNKDGTTSSGNAMRNNLTTDIGVLAGTSTSNNIETTNVASHVVNYSGFDFHLKSGSSAINAGTTVDAPTVDLEQNTRISPYDVGCYEYGSSSDTQAPSVPTGLASGTVTSVSVFLNWNASSDNVGVTGYKVYTNGANPVTVTGTNATISGLSASTQYSFTVSAIDGASNESAQSSAIQVTTGAPDTQAPSVPTGLASSNVTASSVDLSWNASTDNVGVTGYKVYKNGANPVTVTSTGTTINGLTDNTTYTFTVSAIDAASNESAQSSSIQITTLEITSVTSSSLWQSFAESTQTGTFTATFDATPNGSGIDAVTGVQSGTATTWSDLACIVRFNTSNKIDARNGGSYQAATSISYTSGTSYHFRLEINVPAHTYSIYVTPQGQSEITLGTNYAFRTEQQSITQLTGWALQAVSGSHTVDNMSFGGGGGDTEAPSVPTGLAAGVITTSSVALSWNASSDNVGVTGYKVYTNGSNPVSAAGTSATISGLSASTQYSFTVSAYDVASNESAQSSAIQATTATAADTEAPSVPTGLAAGTITTSSVALSWNASTDNVGVTGYKVYTNGSNPVNVAGTSTTITGLSASTQYSFTVSAYDAASNESSQSSAIQATTATPPDTEAPSVPTGLAAGTITASSVALSWNASTDNVGVTGYKVYTNGSNPVNVAGTSTTITGLSASTQYSFTVSAYDAASNESTQSSAIQATTQSSSDPLAANIVGYWPMDQINGSITPDASGNNNDGTISGATTTTGQISGALNFDGSNDYVSLGNLNVAPSSGNDGLTLAAWIRADQWVASYRDDRIISKATSTSEQDHYWMLSPIKVTSSVTRLRFRLKTGTTTTTLIASSGNLQLNTWMHVAATYNGSTMKIYLNGAEVGSDSKTGTVAVNSSVEARVGINGDGQRPFDGQIDEVYILDRALSSQEISGLMTRNSSGYVEFSEATTEPSLHIYPNPLIGNTLNIRVNGYNEDIVNVIIYDMMGKALYNDVHNITGQAEITIPTKLNTGIYIISVDGVQQKLIVD